MTDPGISADPRSQGPAAPEEGSDLLQALIEHELAVKRLYQAFASLFVSHQDFWRTLAGEEQGHADALARLREEHGREALPSALGGLKPAAVRSSIGYVEDQTARAQQGGLDRLKALAIGRDLEDALIERYFSKISGSLDPRSRAVLESLAADTERHRRLLAQALEVERRPGWR